LEETGVTVIGRTAAGIKFATNFQNNFRFCRFRPVGATYRQRDSKGDHFMQYLLLIYGAEKLWEQYTEPEKQTIYKGYRDLIQELQKDGKFIGGHELHPISMATTVRVRDGKKNVTDGPFAETKEQLGGYFLVEAKDLDEAMAIAERIPSATSGAIEVRPVKINS
jgi:hypothetical protein